MKIPEGYETVQQRSVRTGVGETTIRYWLRKGMLPYKTVKIPLRVISKELEPIGSRVKPKKLPRRQK